ncbi:MAG: GNAT family N-acetyltransferase [Desulforhopalus sp.]
MIRPAQKNDLESMIALLKLLFGIEEDFIFDRKRQQRGLELLMDAPNAKILVAERQGTVIGMVTAQLVISTAEGGPALLVEDLVVNPSGENSGAGTALLRAVGEWGANHGASRMQLLADKMNSRALDYYHRRGWQQTQLICLRTYSRQYEANV